MYGFLPFNQIFIIGYEVTFFFPEQKSCFRVQFFQLQKCIPVNLLEALSGIFPPCDLKLGGGFARRYFLTYILDRETENTDKCKF